MSQMANLIKEQRIEELREDILVIEFYIKRTSNPYCIKGLEKLKTILQRSISTLKKAHYA